MRKPLFKLTSLNLNGIRSATSKGLEQWIDEVRPDCMGVQEIKAQAPDVQGRFEQLAGLRGYFHFAEKKGYSGVGVYTRREPTDVVYGFDPDEFDSEGRCIELRFDTHVRRFSVFSIYFPSGSSGPDRQDAKYRFLDRVFPFIQQHRNARELIICSDVNIAHQAIDLKNWKSNQKNSGFLPDERAWMGRLLDSGLVDVYRHLEPEATEACYTWWSNRGQAWAKNVGWRLDYQLATASVAQRARRVHIEKAQRFSDHAPLTIEYDGAL
jgi:exodeoxyribonuclease-3